MTRALAVLAAALTLALAILTATATVPPAAEANTLTCRVARRVIARHWHHVPWYAWAYPCRHRGAHVVRVFCYRVTLGPHSQGPFQRFYYRKVC